MAFINNGLQGEGGTAHAGHGGYLKTFNPTALGQVFDKGPLPPKPVAIPLPGKPTATVKKTKVRNRRVLRQIPNEILNEYIATVARSISGSSVGGTTVVGSTSTGTQTINTAGENPTVGASNTLVNPSGSDMILPRDSVSVNPLLAARSQQTFNGGVTPGNTVLGDSSATPSPASTSTGLTNISPDLSPIPEQTAPSVGSFAPSTSTVTSFRDRDTSMTEVANTIGHDAEPDPPTQRNQVAGNPVSSVLEDGLVLTSGGGGGTTTLDALPVSEGGNEAVTRSGQTLTSIIENADRENRRPSASLTLNRRMVMATAERTRVAEADALALRAPSSNSSSSQSPTGSDATPTRASGSSSIIGTRITLPRASGSSSIIGTRINLPRR